MSRPSFLAGLAGGLQTAASFAADSLPGPAGNSRPFLMFVGTFTGKRGSSSQGIYLYRWLPENGALESLGLAAKTTDPSFLALAPNRKHLYAVNEMNEYEGSPSGSVSAFELEASSGKLCLRNVVSSGGAGPCNITVDRKGSVVFVADYAGGSLSSFRALPEGGLSSPASNFHFEGHSVVESRQAAPHTHCVTVSPDNRWLLVNDLGLDRILVYRFDETTAELTANAPPFYEAIPGSGPRNVAFHPNSRWVYSLNEVSNTVDVLDWDAEKGILTRQQNISTLPPGFTGTNTAGTVAIDSAGRYVYISNRGANDIVVFPVEATNGRLGQALQRISCGGKTPRHIALDPSGRWLLVANQDSGTIDVFARDPESGRLTAGGTQVRVDQPVCIVFV